MPNPVIRFRALTTQKRIVADDSIRPELLRFGKEWGNKVVKNVNVYPPELPNQRYQRTHNLGSGWVVDPRDNPSSIVIRVFNRMWYWPIVQWRTSQKVIHQGRWRVLDDYLDRVGFRQGVMAIYKKWSKR